MDKRKIAIIGTNGLPGNYGGWDQLVINLTEKLSNDIEFIVYAGGQNESKTSYYKGTMIRNIRLNPNGISSIFYDLISMIDATKRTNIFFVCGISGAIFFPIFRLLGKRIILNPDGIEWKRKKFSNLAKIFLWFSEFIGVYFSNQIISDNVKIQEYIFKKYKKSSELIEYGGDHVLSGITLSKSTKDTYNLKPKDYSFKVCRIEPENNIEIILKAFSESEKKLVIVGNWNNSEWGKKIKMDYLHYPNLLLLDPIYDQNILDELRSNCKFYIHGHSVGGTNPSLVEAMNLGLCILAFNVSYNRETTENKALYFSDKDELIRLLNTPSFSIKLCEEKMLDIARNKYSWTRICKMYLNCFQK